MASADDASPGHPIKRARVVYGKRSIHPPHSPALSEQSFDYDCLHHVRTVPRRTPSPSIHASGGERSHSPSAAEPFQFAFRRRLKQIDEQFDDLDAQTSKPALSSTGNPVRTEPSQGEDLQGVSMGTAAFSSEGCRSSGDLSRASLSPPLTSLCATSPQEHPSDSSPVNRHTRGASRLFPSDSEADEPSSSSVSPVRHAITTPHTRSSPTPPTSGDIPMVNKKTKGKVPARDVLPLVFDGERPSAAEIPSKSKKGRLSKPSARSKIKAPTKKERREAVFESSRIAASRPVEVLRTQEQKYSLSTFFAGLRRDSIPTPTLGTELLSDPIERFSSPTDKSAQVQPLDSVFGAPTGVLGTSGHAGIVNHPSLEDTTKVLPIAADSDDEMPSVSSIIQQASGKQQRLQAIKQVALQHADTKKNIDDDSEDDDLLVVKDDMHSVARQEAAQRRLDKAQGSPVKDRISLRRINHPSLRPAAVSPRKLSKRELQELAKPSFARIGKVPKGQLSKSQLDQMMILQHANEQVKFIKQKEDNWVSQGGRLMRDASDDGAQTSLLQKLEVYAEQGLKSVEAKNAIGSEESADESDEDYTPDLEGPASPTGGSQDGKFYCREGSEEVDMLADNMDVSQDPLPPGDGDDDEVITYRRHKHGQRRPLAVVGSDDEEMQPVQRNTMADVQRDSTSAIESQTEDENDKENMAIMRHETPSSELAFSLGLGLLHDTEGASQSGPAGSPKGDVRSPLKDISKDEDDLFLSLPSEPPFADRLLQSARISPRASGSTCILALPPVLQSERICRAGPLFLDLGNVEDDNSRFEALQPSFIEKRQSQSSPELSLACLNPLSSGGFSQFFSAEELCSKKSIDGVEDDGLSLTLDVGLKPALQVSNTLRRKAETIFEKEQDYVVAAAAQQTDRPKELLYVNDHGFLTQTRPEDSSPQIYRVTPSQASKFIGTQVHSTQTLSLGARPPLRTLSFTASQELSPEPQPLGRLRRRSLSPLEQKFIGKNSNPISKLNAFSILGKAKPLSKMQEKKQEKSEFVAVEAEESDEDDIFGFGKPKKDDDDDDDNDEQDKVVEGLVDDTPMDVETEGADLVQEKYREHGEEDDQRLQKLHEDAVEGKFRTKRRGHGIDFEYGSDEDDEDDDERRIRRRIHKKRKIEGDNLEALGQNKETRAFYNTYHQDLVDEDDEFGYLRDDSIPREDGDAQAEEPEEQETITVNEIQQRVREMAKNSYEAEVLDPEDTNWVEQYMIGEADDTVPVKVMECKRARAVRRSNAGQMDFDVERLPQLGISEQERKQMMSWAKNQSHRGQGTGRSGNTTAVTGHTKAKSGGGSLRSTQPPNPATFSPPRKTKASSLLSMVSNRSGRFA